MLFPTPTDMPSASTPLLPASFWYFYQWLGFAAVRPTPLAPTGLKQPASRCQVINWKGSLRKFRLKDEHLTPPPTKKKWKHYLQNNSWSLPCIASSNFARVSIWKLIKRIKTWNAEGHHTLLSSQGVPHLVEGHQTFATQEGHDCSAEAAEPFRGSARVVLAIGPI